MDHSRLVIGGRGNYWEIPYKDMIQDRIEVEPGQEYRLTEKWRSLVYYAWFRTVVGHKKVYLQFKPVNYADYKVGFYYIAESDAKPES